MIIDEKLLAELAIHNLNYAVVCDLFSLSEKERSSPNCGTWIVEQIRNYMTAYTMVNYLKKKPLAEDETPRPPVMEVKPE